MCHPLWWVDSGFLLALHIHHHLYQDNLLQLLFSNLYTWLTDNIDTLYWQNVCSGPSVHSEDYPIMITHLIEIRPLLHIRPKLLQTPVTYSKFCYESFFCTANLAKPYDFLTSPLLPILVLSFLSSLLTSGNTTKPHRKISQSTVLFGPINID